jgi:uroporphyrinogen-III synthase
VLAHAKLASIGETTSAAICKWGKEPDIVAVNATIQALHDAVVSYVGPAPSRS